MNNKVWVNHEELLAEYDKFDNKLFGSQGFCILKDNFIKKVYYEPCTLKYDFSIYKSDRISFPIHYLYDIKNKESDEVVGELMEYFPKKSITWSLTKSVEIDNFIRQYYEIIMEVRKYFEINMHDLCIPNILYNEQSGFSIIDTTNWSIDSGDNSKINKERINRSLFNHVIDEILEITPMNITDLEIYQNLKKYGNIGLELYKVLFLSIMEDEHHLIEMLELYCEVFKNSDFGPIKTLGDIENYTKILKKG